MNNTKKKQRGRLGETWHQLKKNKFAIVGLVTPWAFPISENGRI